jgi:UDP-N-acetylglucosamine 2-epimerase (non-hydrolysing)
MKSKKIVLVAGARPNFMKIGPIYKELKKSERYHPIILHTGQHYDDEMSRIFFRDLELPEPDVYLGVGSASHGIQTGKIMIAFEEWMLQNIPDMVMVVGDVNSTLACSLVAAKLYVPLAHVEAGLRSFDRTMPEEINRMVTDSISDILFTTCRDAEINLLREGISVEKIMFVGNVMIDSLLKFKSQASKSEILNKLGVEEHNYALVTLHRPSNVDDRETLKRIMEMLIEIDQKLPVIFPAHPRTRKMLTTLGADLDKRIRQNLKITDSLGYLDFLRLLSSAKAVLTDSGGIQEETTVLGIPCLTMRDNTERPVTIREGTNVLVGSDREKIFSELDHILAGKKLSTRIPEKWDGLAAARIAAYLESWFKIPG